MYPDSLILHSQPMCFPLVFRWFWPREWPFASRRRCSTLGNSPVEACGIVGLAAGVQKVTQVWVNILSMSVIYGSKYLLTPYVGYEFGEVPSKYLDTGVHMVGSIMHKFVFESPMMHG